MSSKLYIYGSAVGMTDFLLEGAAVPPNAACFFCGGEALGVRKLACAFECVSKIEGGSKLSKLSHSKAPFGRGIANVAYYSRAMQKMRIVGKSG